MPVMKMEDDGEHPAGHYLVVENPDEVSTWHLKVKNADGSINRRLLGAAWAALHEGFRGNKYQGPQKAQALAKLKKLYASEGMSLPSEKAMKATVKALEGGEDDDWIIDARGIPYGSPEDKDLDSEYFDPLTRLHEDKFPLPPAVYYHGYGTDSQPMGKPEYIGKTVDFEDRPDGRWYRVVLDKANAFARRIWEAAQEGKAAVSTGSIGHLVRRGRDGRIAEWPVAELSLIDIGDKRIPANHHAVAIPVMKTVYQQAGLNWPEIDPEEDDRTEGDDESPVEIESGDVSIDHTSNVEETTMDDTEVQKIVSESVAAALKAHEDKRKADEEAAKAQETQVKSAVAAAVTAATTQFEADKKKLLSDFAKANRLPYADGDGIPVIAKYAELKKYDGLNASEMAALINILEGAKPNGTPAGVRFAPDNAYKAFMHKVAEDEGEPSEATRSSMKAAGVQFEGKSLKANEVGYSTLTSYGDEWVGIQYGGQLWESVRTDTVVASRLPSIQVPQGVESIYVPIESTDPTFYLVAQVTSDVAATGLSDPAPTVTSSRLGTGRQQLTLSKIGARVRWSAELDEDSLIPFMPQLTQQLNRAGAETFEHTVIDGDNATAGTTNINTIGGTPGGTEAYLMFDGFRYVALTNNSRSAGTLDADDYLETAYKLGTVGKNADPTRTAFIVEPNTYKKSLLNVTEAKTRDVWGRGSPTIESGVFASIWGYPVFRSYQMHWTSLANTGYEYKANSAGKVDLTTPGNNLYGAILMVRWDQWLLGWRRQIRVTSMYDQKWDGYELAAYMRYGLIYRDTSAASISYNITL